MKEEELKQKRERIQEGAVNVLRTHNVEPGESLHYEYWKEHRAFLIKEIFEILSSEGVKIVDEKAGLPSNPFRDISFTQAVGWDCGKFDILKAGFQKTHPLIEEGE